MERTPDRKEFYAFISYRHVDNLKEGRRWAEWLHRFLENYPVPFDLIGSVNSRSELIPPTLYPIFRDEAEMTPGLELSALIKGGLARSKNLIVLCSPASARSRWVRREIIEFKLQGKDDRILPVLLEGKRGNLMGTTAESIPRALRRGVRLPCLADQRGRVRFDWHRKLAPKLVADFRAEELDQSFTNAVVYRQALEAHQSELGRPLSRRELRSAQKRYEDQLRLRCLGVVAFLLGVEPGEVERRDAVERARRTRERLIAAVAALLLIMALGAIALVQSERRQELLHQASNADLAAAREAGSRLQWNERLRHLDRAVRYWPGNVEATAQLYAELRHGQSSLAPILRWSSQDGLTTKLLAWSPDATLLARTTEDGKLSVWNPKTGQSVSEPQEMEGEPMLIRFTGDSKFLLLAYKVIGLWEVWQVNPLKRIFRSPIDKELVVCPRAFSPDGYRLVTISKEKTHVVQTLDAKEIYTLNGPESTGLSVAWAPDGNRLAVSWHNELRAYDLPPREAHTYIQNFSDDAYDMEFDPLGEHVLIRFAEIGKGFARIWHVGKPDDEITRKVPILAALWQRKDYDLEGLPPMHYSFSFLIVFNEDGSGSVLDPNILTSSGSFNPTGYSVSQIAASPNQDPLLVNGPSRVWWAVDRKNGHLLSSPFRENDVGSMLCVAPDGRALVTGSGPAGFAAWALRAPFPTVEQEVQPTKSDSLARSPDGRWEAFVEGNTIATRSRSTKWAFKNLAAFPLPLRGVAWSSDAQSVTVQQLDNEVWQLAWDPPTEIEDPILKLVELIVDARFSATGSTEQVSSERRKALKTQMHEWHCLRSGWEELLEWWKDDRPDRIINFTPTFSYLDHGE